MSQFSLLKVGGLWLWVAHVIIETILSPKMDFSIFSIFGIRNLDWDLDRACQ